MHFTRAVKPLNGDCAWLRVFAWWPCVAADQVYWLERLYVEYKYYEFRAPAWRPTGRVASAVGEDQVFRDPRPWWQRLLERLAVRA